MNVYGGQLHSLYEECSDFGYIWWPGAKDTDIVEMSLTMMVT